MALQAQKISAATQPALPMRDRLHMKTSTPGATPKLNQIGERVELRAEARVGAQKARGASVQHVEQHGEDDRRDGVRPVAVEGEADRGDAAAQAQQGQCAGHDPADRQLFQPFGHPARIHSAISQ